VRTGANTDERLFAIDADPASPTFNTIIDTQDAGLTNAAGNRGALAVTPNGRYIYSQGFGTPDGRLLIFDRVGRTVTVLSLGSLGVLSFQSRMHVTPEPSQPDSLHYHHGRHPDRARSYVSRRVPGNG
jgi:hypothetical protein